MLTNRSLLTIAIVLVVSSSSERTFAKPAPQRIQAEAPAANAEGAVPAPSPTPERPAPWSEQYAEARAAMLAGNFGAAAAKFEALVDTAPEPGSRYLAAEMMAACRTWAQGGFVLARPHDVRLAPPVLLEDRRTTDEISILYTNAVLYGLYAGLVLDVWTEANSAGGAILPPLLLAGASAGVVALLDRNLDLGYGVAQSIVSGLYVGFEEAIVWAIWHEAYAVRSSEWGAKPVTLLIWGAGTAGAVAGGVVGTLHGTTPGRASLMGSAAMWSSLVAGTLMGGLTGHDDTALLSAAIMLNAGAVAGVVAGAQVSPSIARVRFIDLGGFSGGLLVGGLYWTVQDRNASGRGLLTSTSLGITAGLVTSWILTRDMETDQPRKNREPSFAERLMPVVAPASSGTGFVLGVASTI
jgi:hypothetical protein